MTAAVRVAASEQGRAGIEAIRQRLAVRPRDETLPVEDRRAALEAFTGPSSDRVAIVHETHAGVSVERHDPPGAPSSTAIVYAHGGAYVIGSARTHRALAAAVAAAAGVRLYAVDYRLAPEHPFPAGRDDIVAVSEKLIGNGVALALFGDSAGGGLLLQAALAMRARPAAIAVTSPWVDLAMSDDVDEPSAAAEAMLTPAGLGLDARRYLNGRDPRDPAVAVLEAELRNLPPLLIQVGDQELLLGDALALAERARAADVCVSFEIWESMIHSWHAFRGPVPEADEAIARIGSFLRSHLGLAHRHQGDSR